MSPEIVENYCVLAEKMSLDIENLSYGATYVPINKDIYMGEDKSQDVFWDDQEPIDKHIMTPCFPSFFYPVQTCNEYGSTTHAIPLF